MAPQHACESLAPNLRSIYILLFPSLFISPNFHFFLSILLTPPKPPYLSSKTWQHIWIYLFALLHLSSFFSDLHHSSYSSNLKKVYKIWLFIPHTLLWFLDYLSVANTKKKKKLLYDDIDPGFIFSCLPHSKHNSYNFFVSYCVRQSKLL